MSSGSRFRRPVPACTDSQVPTPSRADRAGSVALYPARSAATVAAGQVRIMCWVVCRFWSMSTLSDTAGRPTFRPSSRRRCLSPVSCVASHDLPEHRQTCIRSISASVVVRSKDHSESPDSLWIVQANGCACGWTQVAECPTSRRRQCRSRWWSAHSESATTGGSLP